MGNLVFQATLGGQVNLVGPNTASTYNLNVPAVSSTIATTSGTETLTNKTLTTPVINGFTGDTSVVNIGSGQFYKDTSGNIGIGVTPSAVNPSGYKTLNIGGAGFSLIGNGTDNHITSNAYYDNNATTWKYALSTTAARYNIQNGLHAWYTAASGTAGNAISFTQAMTLDASGRLGIGTTSPATRLVVGGSTGNYGLQIAARTDFSSISGQLLLTDNTGSACMYSASGALVFATGATVGTDGGTERARIDSSGNLLVGTTTQSGKLTVAGIAATTGYATRSGTGGSYGGNSFNINWTGSPYLWIDTTNIGQLATVSDYRLKENVTTQDEAALPKVMQLNPVKFNRKEVGIFAGSDAIEEGFIAHELQAIIPSSVHGDKDAVTEDGGIQPQSLNWAPIVSVLTKAIQELKAEFDAYKATHP